MHEEREREREREKNPGEQGAGAAIAGTMGGLGQGMGGVSQSIGDARMQAASMPGGMGNPRHAMSHMQGVTLDGSSGAPQYRQGDFQSKDGPQHVQLERSIVLNNGGKVPRPLTHSCSCLCLCSFDSL